MAYRRERALLNGSSQKRSMRSRSSSSSHGDHEEPALRERALLNGSSQKRNMRSRSPSSSHGDQYEEPALQQQQQNAHQVTTYSFALVNWGGGSSTEDASGYVSLVKEVVQSCERMVKEVVQSCERIVVDARTDLLLTLRYLAKFASMVAITTVVSYYLFQIVTHRV